MLKAKASCQQSSACWNKWEHRVTLTLHPGLQLFKSLTCHIPPKCSFASACSSGCLLFAASGPTFAHTGSPCQLHLTWVALLKLSRLQGPLSAILFSKHFVYRQDSIRQTTELCQSCTQRLSMETWNTRIVYNPQSIKCFILFPLSRKPVSCELDQKSGKLKV